MREFVIMTDSCCDLDAQMAAELQLQVLPLSFRMEEQSYRNLLDGSEMAPKAFYDKMRAGATATTAAVNVGEFTDAMRDIVEQGKDILYLAFSGALSTTYQSAVIAASDLKEEYPDANIVAVDTKCASLGQGLLVYLAAQEKRAGKSLEEVKTFVEETIPNLDHWFTVNDLEYLRRGGRLSGAAAFFGTMLSIKPVLHVDDEGRLIAMAKVRGRKAALKMLLDKMEELGKDRLKDQVIFICQADCGEEAEMVAKQIKERYDVKEVFINYIGPVIGSHTGPGTMGVFFLGEHR